LKLSSTYRALLVTLILAALVVAGCSRNTYPYNKKRKKRKCDCPEWSYQLPDRNQTTLSLT
jgi:PBP1b-binding outer membrane lipoprotein LpoB